MCCNENQAIIIRPVQLQPKITIFLLDTTLVTWTATVNEMFNGTHGMPWDMTI
jgi:hypothetical protein